MRGIGPGLHSLETQRAAEQDPEDEPCALERLACLPIEMQDAVIRHLPLADLLVWQRLNRNFYHRIRVGAFLEPAFCRALGHAFPRAGLDRDNYERLLRPWLAGFSASPSGRELTALACRPPALFCTVSRTLRATRRLGLREQVSFRLPGLVVTRICFSPDGAALAVRIQVGGEMGGRATPWYVFGQQGSTWHVGTAFAGQDGLYGLAFAPDGGRIALVPVTTEVRIWEKRQGAGPWQQTACLAPDTPLFHLALEMQFSPDGRSLAVQGGDGSQYVWDLDERQKWQASGPFRMGSPYGVNQPALFSPDGRWLLMQAVDQKFWLARRTPAGRWTMGQALVPVIQDLVDRAVFRPGGRHILLHLSWGVLSLWQLHAGQSWQEVRILSHQDGIRKDGFCFSPDGEYLLTRSKRVVGGALWAEREPCQWQPLWPLGDTAACEPSLYAQCFDPGSRWFVAGTLLGSIDRKGWEMWCKDRFGHWRSRPAGELSAGLFPREKELAVAADGQHLAVLNCPGNPQQASPHSLRLLELQQGSWVIKADYPVERYRYDRIVMDPFCCHLAVVVTWRPEVVLLRVQEAPPT